jgi:hypothetical protein
MQMCFATVQGAMPRSVAIDGLIVYKSADMAANPQWAKRIKTPGAGKTYPVVVGLYQRDDTIGERTPIRYLTVLDGYALGDSPILEQQTRRLDLALLAYVRVRACIQVVHPTCARVLTARFQASYALWIKLPQWSGHSAFYFLVHRYVLAVKRIDKVALRVPASPLCVMVDLLLRDRPLPAAGYDGTDDDFDTSGLAGRTLDDVRERAAVVAAYLQAGGRTYTQYIRPGA